MSQSSGSNETNLAQEARDWIMRLSSGDMNETDMAEYHQWVATPHHDAAFQHELALWRSFSAIGDHLAPAGDIVASRASRRRWITYAVGAVAASLVLMAVAPEVSLRWRADHRTTQMPRSIALADGSTAMLDADSAISVDYTAKERRIVLLRGRAWFSVAHGNPKPFRVDTSRGRVEDIGTAFEVRTDAHQTDVMVSDGRVRIAATGAENHWMELKAGQHAFWSDSGKETARAANVPVGRIAAWREGDILLDTVPVRAAINEIARYRKGWTFISGDIDSKAPVTAIIRIEKPDEGLAALAVTSGLSITHLPGGIALVRPAR